MKRILVTGGAGFIGSNFINYMLNKYSDLTIVNLDKLTYAGNLDNVEVKTARHHFIKGDILDYETVLMAMDDVDAVVHFAAESHVDRSIASGKEFVNTNVMGTQVLLDVARGSKIKKFIHVSTDEVYGSLEDGGFFTENSPLAANSPYSASKASSDLIARSYFKTYGVPVCITRCSNNYGPYQYPEKLIPVLTLNALNNKPLPIYGTGQNVRDWLHVSDHCRAIELVLLKGTPGEVYNIGDHNEKTNLDIAKKVLEILGKDESLITFVEDRLGHDWRYAIDSSKIKKELGWQPQVDFETGLKDTVNWYVMNYNKQE